MIASSKNQVSTRRKKDTKHKRQNAKGKRQGKEVEGVNDNNTTSINCAKFLVLITYQLPHQKLKNYLHEMY